jgi:hypothetical protein
MDLLMSLPLLSSPEGMSDVYLAQPAKDSNLPSRLCIKVAVNKLEKYVNLYPPEQALSTLAAQKKLQIAMGYHPFFVKTFPEVFPNRPDIMALELGCCSLEALQFVSGNPLTEKGLDGVELTCESCSWQALGHGSKGQFHPITVKYFAAQAFLMLHHLRSKRLLWADPKQGNMIVFPDFSIRAIDVGHGAPMTDDKAKRCDFFFTAGFLLNLSVSLDCLALSLVGAVHCESLTVSRLLYAEHRQVRTSGICLTIKKTWYL